MVTITQVAVRAGVSIKTVSRVINEEAHVTPKLREQVLQAVAELQYRPSLAARQLAGNRSFLISMIIPNAMDSYYSTIVGEAATECRNHNYHLVSESFDPGEPGGDVIGRITSRFKPDGIILLPPFSTDELAIGAADQAGTPVVRMAGVRTGSGLVVEVHQRDIARDLVDHLIGCGHSRIGFIAPPEARIAAQERGLGYRDALEAAGLAYDPALVIRGDFTFESGVRAAARMLGRPDRPTAVFASNDTMALGAMAVARRFGLAIPHDVAIAGFDDSPGSRMTYPALTTVSQPFAAMARNAVRLLLGKGDEQPLEHGLMLRGSTTGIDDLPIEEGA